MRFVLFLLLFVLPGCSLFQVNLGPKKEKQKLPRRPHKTVTHEESERVVLRQARNRNLKVIRHSGNVLITGWATETDLDLEALQASLGVPATGPVKAGILPSGMLLGSEEALEQEDRSNLYLAAKAFLEAKEAYNNKLEDIREGKDTKSEVGSIFSWWWVIGFFAILITIAVGYVFGPGKALKMWVSAFKGVRAAAKAGSAMAHDIVSGIQEVMNHDDMAQNIQFEGKETTVDMMIKELLRRNTTRSTKELVSRMKQGEKPLDQESKEISAANGKLNI